MTRHPRLFGTSESASPDASLLVSANPGFNYAEHFRFHDYQHGVIRIDDDIDSDSCATWLGELRNVDKMIPDDQSVVLAITSSGGGAYYAFALYDAIQVLKRRRNVICQVDGFAASAASMIVLQAGNLRVCGPSARFLLHEVRRWGSFAVETASDIKDEYAELKAINDRIIGIISERCGKTINDVTETITRKERWMSSAEALEFGLIDRIA